MAIETGLVVRMIYKLAYRQTQGLLKSIATLLGLGIEIPDYSTLCRRSKALRKKLQVPKDGGNQPIHLMIDSTGLKIHVGSARKPPKKRAWRKLHLAVGRQTGNIVATELTASGARDASRVPALLTQIETSLASVSADCAYDKEPVYEAIEGHSPGRRTRVIIPPQRNAVVSPHRRLPCKIGIAISVQSNGTVVASGTRLRAPPKEAWSRMRSIATRRSSAPRCGPERWPGSELNTGLVARFSTK